MAFKPWLTGNKVPKVSQENILHTITPPAVWTVDTRQVRSRLRFMLLMSNCDPTICGLLQQKWSFIKWNWPEPTSASHLLFLAGRIGIGCDLLLQGSVVCSVILFYSQLYRRLSVSSNQSGLFSSDLWNQLGVSILMFFVFHTILSKLQSQEISSSKNTQSNPTIMLRSKSLR